MRSLLSLLFLLGACAPTVPQAPDASTAMASEDATAELAVIGDGDGAVVLLSVTDHSAVALDAERPARLMIGGKRIDAAMLDAPSMRQIGDQTATGASYRIGAEAASELARGGDVDVELSIGGTYRSFRASRADILQ